MVHPNMMSMTALMVNWLTSAVNGTTLMVMVALYSVDPLTASPSSDCAVNSLALDGFDVVMYSMMVNRSTDGQCVVVTNLHNLRS